MAYSNNPNLPKARAIAMKLLITEKMPVGVVARKCGIHRITLWRWKNKWDELNKNVQMDNPNRPNRNYSERNHLLRCVWNIPTKPSIPKTFSGSIPDILAKIVLDVRTRLNRCSEAVWHHLNTKMDICISLSSVKRILKRNHCFDGARKPRIKPDNPRRPHPIRPGDLVQIDTIHHVDPHTQKRLYYYTAIDLYTRMTYATMSAKLRPSIAAETIMRAKDVWGFPIHMVQADNGPEFSRYFEQQLKKQSVPIPVRHSRLGRPNDNAHIERFNRTIQEECIGHYWRASVPLTLQQKKLEEYLDHYNNDRVHLGIQLRTPMEMLQRF